MLRLITITGARRQNPDGTSESICGSCFVTVTIASWEADFDRAEGKRSRDANEPRQSGKAIDHEHYDYE